MSTKVAYRIWKCQHDTRQCFSLHARLMNSVFFEFPGDSFRKLTSYYLRSKGQKVILKCKLDCLPVEEKHRHRHRRHHDHHYHQTPDYMPRGRPSKYHYNSITCLRVFSLTSEMNCQVNGTHQTAGVEVTFRRPERFRPSVWKYL